MLDNAPLHTLTHKGITVEGYSRAAVQTYYRLPELKLGFDFGAQPWSFMGTATWFLTHAHLDHVAALPVYVARRRMMKMEPPTIYMPESCVETIDKILKLFTRLDRGRMPCQLVGLQPGSEVELSREHVVTVSATKHTVPSLGYVVWERRRKLKPEYAGLGNDQIRDLRLGGTDVTSEQRTPLVAFLGDSAPEGLDSCPAMYQAKILITEISFVHPSHRKEKIHKFGHIHLDDIIERRAKFANEVIIAGHFSTRYEPERIVRIVNKRLPDMLGGRLRLWI